LALDLSYRYANLGSTTVGINTQTGATISQRNSEHDIRVGVRLMAD
jgi:opacity protein-like surface antigen